MGFLFFGYPILCCLAIFVYICQNGSPHRQYGMKTVGGNQQVSHKYQKKFLYQRLRVMGVIVSWCLCVCVRGIEVGSFIILVFPFTWVDVAFLHSLLCVGYFACCFTGIVYLRTILPGTMHSDVYAKMYLTVPVLTYLFQPVQASARDDFEGVHFGNYAWPIAILFSCFLLPCITPCLRYADGCVCDILCNRLNIEHRQELLDVSSPPHGSFLFHYLCPGSSLSRF